MPGKVCIQCDVNVRQLNSYKKGSIREQIIGTITTMGVRMRIEWLIMSMNHQLHEDKYIIYTLIYMVWAWYNFHLPCRAVSTDYARRKHEITCVMEPMSPTETHLNQNVTLATTTETIVENWSVTMKQNVTRVSGPNVLHCHN